MSHNDNVIDLMRENAAMRTALEEAERYIAYYSGESDGVFVGSGMPADCLRQIRAALGKVST